MFIELSLVYVVLIAVNLAVALYFPGGWHSPASIANWISIGVIAGLWIALALEEFDDWKKR